MHVRNILLGRCPHADIDTCDIVYVKALKRFIIYYTFKMGESKLIIIDQESQYTTIKRH